MEFLVVEFIECICESDVFCEVKFDVFFFVGGCCFSEIFFWELVFDFVCSGLMMCF